MPKRKTPEALFERARENGSENKSETLNGIEVEKQLQPKTRTNYERALSLWDYYSQTHPEASPHDIESSKGFVRALALGIEGAHGIQKAGLGTVIQYYKDFTAAWRRFRKDPISSSVTLSTSNYIKYVLFKELDLPQRKRLRRYGTMIHFVYLGTQLWESDWFIFQKPGRRVRMWALIMACVFSSSRIGEYVESTCRLGTRRGLYYRDVICGVFRNEQGQPEIAIQLKRDAKGMTFTPDKRPEHALHEGLDDRPLLFNPVLVFLSIFFADKALRDYSSMEEVLRLQPLEHEMVPLRWDPNVLNVPIFQGNTGEMETAASFGRHLRELGVRAGYSKPPTVHDFRAEGLFLIDKQYSSSARMKHGGQRDENTYRDYYAPNNPGTDGQGSYFGSSQLRTLVSDRFRGISLTRNPELWQSLPAEKRHELESGEDFTALETEIESLRTSDDPNAKTRRKELHTQKRKLVAEQLRKCQEDQAHKPLPEGSASAMGPHRAIFERTRHLMPERDRLSRTLFEIAPIRSRIGREVLEDLVSLCKQQHEVSVRPGLETDKCNCHGEGQGHLDNLANKPASERWKHIYVCYRRQLLLKHDFAEFCFLCGTWVTSQQEWHDHCQRHLESQKSSPPSQCNPLVYGGTIASPGFCPFCLGDKTLSAPMRMRQFVERTEWKNHIHSHLEALEAQTDKAPTCPLNDLHCNEAFATVRELRFHLEDVHCVDVSTSTHKRATSGASLTGSSSSKRRKVSPGPDDVDVKQESTVYEFVDESLTVGGSYRVTKAPAPASGPPSLASSRSSSPGLDLSRLRMKSETPFSWRSPSPPPLPPSMPSMPVATKRPAAAAPPPMMAAAMPDVRILGADLDADCDLDAEGEIDDTWTADVSMGGL